MKELPVPQALQAFLWVQEMKYVPENIQIKALNAAKSTNVIAMSQVK